MSDAGEVGGEVFTGFYHGFMLEKPEFLGSASGVLPGIATEESAPDNGKP